MCCCNLQKDEFLRLAINGIHNDLISRNEAFQSLALTFVSNSKPPAAVGPAP
jgi:vesicle coat complex subunit